MEEFLAKTLQKMQTKAENFATKAENFAIKSAYFSQLRNVLSPTWERFIPTVGRLFSTNGKFSRGVVLTFPDFTRHFFSLLTETIDDNSVVVLKL